MKLIDRRMFMKGVGGLSLGTLGLGADAFVIEPGFMLDHTPYQVTPNNWPSSLSLKIAVIADIHACEPWMSAARVRSICEFTNALEPDLIVVLGDFNAGHSFVTAPVFPDQWGESLAVLKAPLGVFAVLGNHDWWHGALPTMRGNGAESVRRALRSAGVQLLENDAIRLRHQNQSFWLLGLGDQMVHRLGRGVYEGSDDLSGTLAQVTDKAPIILLAHEPFIFPRVPHRVSLTLCGHTHGGQVALPFIGNPFGRTRFHHAYGHLIEDDRHLIVSAGLGTSYAPVRFCRPPEVVSVMLGHPLLQSGPAHMSAS